MVEFALATLIIGDYIFTNRENVFFALDNMRNELIRRNELR
jgi:hypothetical protein